MNKEQAAKLHHIEISEQYDNLPEHELITNAFIAGATWQEQQNKVNIPVPNELIEQINILHSCLVDAPVDFMGTSSNWRAAEKERIEWVEKYTGAYIKATELLQHTRPHSTYMEFAEWCIEQKIKKIHNGDNEVLYFDCQEFFGAPDLFQYWITNVKNKG